MFNSAVGWSSGTRTLDFVNVSFVFPGMIDQYTEQALRFTFDDSIAALAQSGVSDKTVFVWGAGNAHGDPCDQADFIANTGSADLCESYVENGETKYRVNAKTVEHPGRPARADFRTAWPFDRRRRGRHGTGSIAFFLQPLR